MASNSGWSKNVPSGLSQVALGDDDIRSFKSFMQAWWEQEHYATDGSANSAGVAKIGSARVYAGAPSLMSNPTGDGSNRVLHSSTDGALYVANASSSSWSAALPVYPGVFSGVTSTYTVLAADAGCGVNPAAVAITMLNPGGTRFHLGDTLVASVGSQPDPAGSGSWVAFAKVNGSAGSLVVSIPNFNSGSRLTFTSGTTVHVLGFRLSTVMP